jgi:predicted MFS family arabinose efflux permease
LYTHVDRTAREAGRAAEADSADRVGLARPSAADRLDRLPIASFHREITWLLGFVFFFELGDINTFSFAAPALLKAWHLSVSTISVIVSATFLGMFVGATTGGWFSDRVGRKRALVVTVAWYSAFSMLNACVWDTKGLFVARLLTGVGLSAMTVVAITYVSEMFPARWRGTYQGWIMTIGLIGSRRPHTSRGLPFRSRSGDGVSYSSGGRPGCCSCCSRIGSRSRRDGTNGLGGLPTPMRPWIASRHGRGLMSAVCRLCPRACSPRQDVGGTRSSSPGRIEG